MVDEEVLTFFNKTYDKTYKKTLLYVTKKCSSIEDINDILQETYIEVYSVLIKKGVDYIENPEAFVLKIAKRKIYKYYFMVEKLKSIISIFSKNEEDEEINIIDIEVKEISLEDKIINRSLIEEIGENLSSKSKSVKKIFYMYYYLDLTIPQISKELSISQSNVKNKLYRTIKEIRNLYDKDGV